MMKRSKFFSRALKTLGITNLTDHFNSKSDLISRRNENELDIVRLKDVIEESKQHIADLREQNETINIIVEAVKVEEVREKQKGTLAFNAEISFLKE